MFESSVGGIDIHESPILETGKTVLVGSSRVFLGTRPRTPIEEAGREARLIVREGMRDVLEYIGKPFNDEPDHLECYWRWGAIAALANHVPVFVVAPHYRAFQYWCMEKNLNPRTRNLRYFADAWSLRGYRPKDAYIIELDGWADRLGDTAVWNIEYEIRHFLALGARVRMDTV